MVGGLSSAVYTTHAANLNFTADTTLSLTSPAVNFTVLAGSVASSLVVNPSNVVVTIPAGSSFTLTSASRDLTVTGKTSDAAISIGCTTNTNVANLSVSAQNLSSQTLTITPAALQCVSLGGGGGSSSGGSGGGGGGGGGGSPVSTTPTSPTTPVAAVAPAVSATPAAPAILQALPYAQPKTVAELQANLNVLLENLAVLQAAQKAVTAPATGATVPPAGSYKANLYLNSKGNDVTALQNFLKSQGPDIYPEGLVTGHYGNLTRAAVGRFQLKNGIVKSTRDPGYGNVGPKTRAKINQLLGR